MTLSPADRELVDAMKQRELHLKRRQRAADRVEHELRRHGGLVVAGIAACVVVVVMGVFLAVESTLPDPTGWWRPTLVVVVIAVVLGALLGQALLRTRRGRAHLARHRNRLWEKYAGDLYAARRWTPFHHQGEDVAAYVSQVLYFLEGGRGCESVAEALALARSHPVDVPGFADRARARFDAVAASTNHLVLTSTDATGNPSSRVMTFVRSDLPDTWYVATPPVGPKVEELDLGRVALVTLPPASGGTISSNRVRVRRAPVSFSAVADLYRTQVPEYVEEMTSEERQHELVYELTLESAKVDTWDEHHVVHFAAERLPAEGET